MSQNPFPGEWTLESGIIPGPTLTTLVIPASGPGVQHVLTHLHVVFLNFDSTLYQARFQVLDGATLIHQGLLVSPLSGSPSGTNVVDVEVDEDIVLMGSAQTSMTIGISGNGTNANYQQAIYATGYDQ